MSNNFDWKEAAADGDIVCHEQPETAVYANPVGAACIRQRAVWPEEDDSVVIIQPENAARIALAMLQAAGFDGIELIRRVGGGYEDLDVDTFPGAGRKVLEAKSFSPAQASAPASTAKGPALEVTRSDDVTTVKSPTSSSGKIGPKDRTAAERKRRQRQRDSHGHVTAESVTVTAGSVTGLFVPNAPQLFDDEGQKEPALTR